jgi:hypothetical protein
MENFFVDFSIVFVMLNALFLLVSRVADFIIELKRKNNLDRQSEMDNLKKENSLSRIKIQQLEENNEHLSIKLQNKQSGLNE